MIIKDKEGVKYKLGKNKLTTSRNQGYVAFYIEFKDVRAHNLRSAQLFVNGCTPETFIRVPIRPESGHIGCRKFSDKTMKVILKAIRGKRGK